MKQRETVRYISLPDEPFNPVMLDLILDIRECDVERLSGVEGLSSAADLLNGTRSPTIEELCALCNVLKVLPGFFYCEGERHEPLCTHYVED